MQRRDAALRAMKGHPNSPRRARILIGVDLKAVRRERPPDNAEVRLEMHRVAEKRRRFGYLVTPRPALATPEIDQHQTQGLSR